MKTRKEVESLKAGWLRDPCWDIEGTEGFEEHEKELLAFRRATEARWAAKAAERQAALDAEADQLGVRGLLRLVRQVEALQARQQQAILFLTEGQAGEAWRVLTGTEEA